MINLLQLDLLRSAEAERRRVAERAAVRREQSRGYLGRVKRTRSGGAARAR
jgi:hypothetical protein